MAYISNDGMSLFYRVATATAPLCAPDDGTRNLGPLTMMIDVMAPTIQTGPANSELGFKFPLCLQNQVAPYGATLGLLWQDQQTFEGMTCRDDKHGNYPGAGPTVSADGVSFINNTSAGTIWTGFPRGRWLRLLMRTERRGSNQNMRGWMAISGTGTWASGSSKSGPSPANVSIFDRICIGGRHRPSTNAAFTLTANATGNSGTFNGTWNDFNYGSDATNGTGFSWSDIVTITFNSGATRVLTGIKTGINPTVTWGGAAVSEISPNIQINTIHPNGFIQPNTAFANATFWDSALTESDIQKLMLWGHPLSVSRQPYEFYPFDLDEGSTPTDRMRGYRLTQFGSGLEYLPKSLQLGHSTFTGITSPHPPVLTPSRVMSGTNKLLFSMSLLPPVVGGGSPSSSLRETQNYRYRAVHAARGR